MTEQRTWALEFGYEYKVPKTLDDMVENGYLTDNSWHNDVCPHFERITHRGLFALWVAHPDKKRREFEEQPRYTLFLTPSDAHGSPENVYEIENPQDDICLYRGDSFVLAIAALVKNAKGYERLEELAKEALPLTEDEWGSERQINAENAFFEAVGDLGEQFDTWSLKATTEERIAEALRLVAKRP